jgi:DNA-binding IscR family transcriptional regulator
MKGFWKKMNEQIEDILSKMTLKDIIDEIKK